MLERVVFVLVVCGVYLGMNWYVLARLFSLCALKRTIGFYLALIPLTLSFIVALVLESTIGNRLTGMFFTLAMTWLGACFLLLWILFVQQVLSWVLPIPRRVWAAGICGLAALLVVYSIVNARSITVRREQIRGLPFKIAQLSDVHIGSIEASTLADIIAKTNALNPDLVLITGDLFDNATATTRALSVQLKAFAAPVMFTSGNHEAYAGYDNVRQMLSPAKIRWLRNEAMEFKGIRIIGVDNSYGTELLQSVLGRTPPSTVFTVLMNHQPRGFDVAARHRINLMLSGHVHNGQIWPFNYIVGLFYPYLKGLHEHADAFLNVSTGTGIWGPPMRLGSRSEIVLLEPRS
jgi:predicted MPP superfamily phosphohydrolase